MKKHSLLLVAVAMILAALPSNTFAQDETDWGSAKANCTGVKMTKIGYSPLLMGFDYFQFIAQGMKEIADQCKVKLVIDDPNADAAKQVSGIENMVSSGIGSVAIYDVDPQAILTAVDTAHKANVTVIAAVSAFKGADVYVGISDYDFGRLGAELVGQALAQRKPGKANYKVAILNADSLGSNLLDRKKGLQDGLKKYIPNFTIAAKCNTKMHRKNLKWSAMNLK